MTSPVIHSASPAQPPLEPALQGFEKVARRWSLTRQRYIAKIGPGEYFVSAGSELIVTVLGSCIAACVRDVSRNLGGMNHFMLPTESNSTNQGDSGCINAALRYGSFAMEHLLNEFYSRGSRRENLEIKLFGGGQVMASSVRVGEQNIDFARQFLANEGYFIEREDVGGYSGRKLLYDPVLGRALVKRTHSGEEQELIRREQSYIDSLNSAPVTGELELF